MSAFTPYANTFTRSAAARPVPLLDAIEAGRFDDAIALIENGEDVNAADQHGNSPLMSAVWQGDEELVRQLLKAGAHTEACDQNGQTALMLAARANRPGIIHVLAENGAAIEAPDQKDLTAFGWAARTNRPEAMVALREHGADQESRDQNGLTPAHWAARTNAGAALLVLAKLGANLEARSPMRGTFVTDEAPGPNLEAGPLPGGFTPLMLAAWNGNRAATTILLKQGVAPDAVNQAGRIARDLAQESGHEDIAALLPKPAAAKLRHLKL